MVEQEKISFRNLVTDILLNLISINYTIGKRKIFLLKSRKIVVGQLVTEKTILTLENILSIKRFKKFRGSSEKTKRL